MTTRCERKTYQIKVYLLYYYEKILGLCPLKINQKLFSITNISILYTIILCTIYSLIFYQNIIYRFRMTYGIENFISAIWDRILQILQYILIIITWLNFGLRQKKIKSIVNNFNKTREIAENLGIRNDNFEIIQIIINYTLIINFLYFFLFSVHLNLNITFSSDREKIFALLNSLFRIVYHNMFFLFISALHILYQRFRQLNICIKFFKLSKISHEPLYR